MITEFADLLEPSIDRLVAVGITEEEIESLTDLEREILFYMSSWAGYTLSAHEIMVGVNPYYNLKFTSEQSSSQYSGILSNIRKKIGNNVNGREIIVSQIGLGFRFDDPNFIGPHKSYYINGVHMDLDSKLVFVDGQDVGLTALEYRILKVLMENANKRFTVDQIINAVKKDEHFNDHYDFFSRMNQIISKIRKKIGLTKEGYQRISTINKLGYMFLNPDQGEGNEVIEYRGINIDFDKRQVFVEGFDLQLNALEYRILAVFMRNRGRTMSSVEVMERVNDDPVLGKTWNYPEYLTDRLSSIRKKLLKHDTELPIYNYDGMGYVLI